MENERLVSEVVLVVVCPSWLFAAYGGAVPHKASSCLDGLFAERRVERDITAAIDTDKKKFDGSEIFIGSEQEVQILHFFKSFFTFRKNSHLEQNI